MQKIIDFNKKGNIVRFYLGEKTADYGWTDKDYKRDGKTPTWLKPENTYYGDDWDDYPYDCNAGQVYDYFIKAHRDIVFNFDDLVLEPCEGYTLNCEWCKNDMKQRKVPCIIVVPAELAKSAYQTDFNFWVANDAVKKYYFGDALDV